MPHDMVINEKNLSSIDLNLVVTFLVVFREENVTRAALCMNVGQPAVSGSLVRLRALFKDPLFVRVKSGVRPTETAIIIAQRLLPAMSIIEATFFGNV
jgi:DNA-binding transcriptional LysR family regulator